jgi:hypothetical protein
MHHMRTLITAGLAACLTVGAGCKKGDDVATRTDSAAGTVATSTVKVADVTLGRGVGPDMRITDRTDDFKPNDTIYASVHTTGAAPSATLTARWMFEDGQVVDETSRPIAPTGEADTEFHIAKPGGLPTGKYMLHLLLDGTEVQKKEFEVKR